MKKSLDLTAKTSADLAKLALDKREELRAHRFGGAGAKTKNVKAARVIRKDIARIMTALNAQK